MALLDWEPQGSLTLWWVMRGKPDNPRLIREDVEPAEALRKLSEPTSHPTEGAVAKLIAYACLVVSGTLAAVYGYTTGNTELYGLYNSSAYALSILAEKPVRVVRGEHIERIVVRPRSG